jgi:hypothetical protein
MLHKCKRHVALVLLLRVRVFPFVSFGTYGVLIPHSDSFFIIPPYTVLVICTIQGDATGHTYHYTAT